MNPLLLDPWMVVHPPLTFIAYALLIIPYAYAVASLWEKDYQKGFLKTIPWALVGWFFLGAGGIIVGGAWAYRVLGWGGYWGWDPVENATLIPWLTGGALIHGLLIQKQKQHLTRSNIFLAITTYLLIIFATFLTRSGVMAGFSVHAFAETRLTNYLALFILVFAVVGYGLFILRYKDMDRPAGQAAGIFSRPGSFSLTMILLCIAGVVVLVGTLSPIITGWVGAAASADQSYYNRTNAPLLLLLFAVLAVCPYLRWQQKSIRELFEEIKYYIFASLAVLPLAYSFGVRDPFILLLLWVIILSFFTNFVALKKVWRKGLKFSGGYLTHLGLALMFAGIVVSTVYTHSQVIFLYPEQPVEVHGYSFNFSGYTVENDTKIPCTSA